MNWILIAFGSWNIFDGVWSLWYPKTTHTLAADVGRVVRIIVGIAIIVLAILMR